MSRASARAGSPGSTPQRFMPMSISIRTSSVTPSARAASPICRTLPGSSTQTRTLARLASRARRAPPAPRPPPLRRALAGVAPEAPPSGRLGGPRQARQLGRADPLVGDEHVGDTGVDQPLGFVGFGAEEGSHALAGDVLRQPAA